jgi:predicted enzyme related to lactoylglutathione lyase
VPDFRLSAVTVDCLDPALLADFWSALLGLERTDMLPGWVRLGRRGVDVPVLNFQPVPERKEGKNRLHLDLVVDDVDAALDRVVALGGRATGERHEYDAGTVVVLADPEGNEFCVTRYVAAPPDPS